VSNAQPGSLLVTRLGTVPYAEALALQNEVRAARQRGDVPDTLLLLEHHPVYTRGRRTLPAELPMGEQWYAMQGIEVAETDRGGAVTYHGPGQLVAYPIVDLAGWGDDVHAYVRRLEAVMEAALGDHGVPTQIFDGLTGTWTAGQPPIPAGSPGPQGTPVGPAVLPGEPGAQARKIGSIGIHVSKGVTTHGLAVNVANDLQPFEWIVPCGIEYVRMTSLSREHDSEQSAAAFGETIARRFADVFGLALEDIEPEDLRSRLGAAAAS
jgi:lipoyl(octanoyl) transferase